MDAAVITQTSGAETFIKYKSARVLDDVFFISLNHEIQNGLKTPGVSRTEVLAAIASGNISSHVITDMEDAILGSIIEDVLNEGSNSESVGFEEIMKTLDE